MSVDLDIARRFLSALTGEDNPLACWQTFDDSPAKRKEMAGQRTLRFAAAQSWLLEANDAGAGIFVTVNQTDGRGRSIENVVGLRALFVDCDGTSSLPERWALAPSIVVRRDATHWHAYWLLAPGEDQKRFTAAQVQLAGAYGSDPSVKDLPRVMRIPGFLHRKGDPILVELLRGDRSTLATIDQILAAHPVDWATVSETHRKHAVSAGIIPEPAKVAGARSAPRPRPPAGARGVNEGELTDHQWMVEQTRKFMLAMNTHEGSGNPRGGRDNAGFELACKCSARGLSEAEASDLVREYWARSGGGLGESDVERVVRSAFSKPRQDHIPVRRSAPAMAGGGRGGREEPPEDDRGGRGDDPPGPPPSTASGGRGGEPGPWGGLATSKLSLTWIIGKSGVAPIEWNAKDKEHQPKPNKRVCDLPIWPEQPGVDVATRSMYWRLAWVTPNGEIRRQWLPELDMKIGLALVSLPDGPVTKQKCEGCATWLTAARVAVTQPIAQVTSRLGWCGAGDERRWVWPTAAAAEGESITYIGAEMAPPGELAAWRAGADHLIGLPDDDGYPAMVVLGFSIGAAFSRIAGARNPVLGLMGPSSTGKGSAMTYALSAWMNPDQLSVPASSTAKGVQDKATGIPDCPILLDELQQLAERDPHQASDALYYLANGQRRVTSSRTQEARGGDRRHGCGFYAAEAPILPGLNTGVHFRVIELTQPTCPDEATAKVLQRAARAHGALAGALAKHLASRAPSAWKTAIDAAAKPWRAGESALKGDDPEALAILQVGLETLGQLLGAAVPAEAICQWLAGRLKAQRALTEDRETAALGAVLDLVLNGHFTVEEQFQESSNGQLVAWRKIKPTGHTVDGEAEIAVDGLDVNTMADGPRRVLESYGGEKRVLSAWARRGWIQTDGRHLKVKKQHGGRPVGRVVRFTRCGIDAYLEGASPHSPLPSPQGSPHAAPF